MVKILLACLVVFLWPANQEPALHKLRVERDKENVVASRLEGTWQVQEDLSERLTGKKEPRATGLTFTSDPAIAAKVPDKFAKFFIENKMKIYMAGNLQLNETKCPFVLTNVRGNPHVFFWLEKDGNEFGNSESFNVMLAVAKDSKDDLLFIGGDFNNQAFSAFERSKPVGVKVSGHVTIDGKPLEFGGISFKPTSGGRASGGIVGEKGAYFTSTYKANDGLKPGSYTVAIHATQIIDERSQRWHAPEKYSNHKTSGLKVEVTEETDDLNFDLSWEGDDHAGPWDEKL